MSILGTPYSLNYAIILKNCTKYGFSIQIQLSKTVVTLRKVLKQYER